MEDNAGASLGANNKELWVSRVVCAVGAVAGLSIIPVALTSRRRVFQKRTDLASDDMMLLFEKLLMLKGGLDPMSHLADRSARVGRFGRL